jgi:hypothetical protein
MAKAAQAVVNSSGRRRSRRSSGFEVLESLVNLNAPPAYVLPGIDFSPYILPGENPNNGPGQITNQELLQRMEVIAPDTQWIRTQHLT